HEKSFLLQESASTVWSISFYEDSLLVPVSNDIIQKDIHTGSVQRTFRAHKSQVRSFIVTGASRLISSASDDMIIVWDLDTGSILKRIFLKAFNTIIRSISVQSNQLFTGGSDGIVRHVDLLAGKVMKTIDFNRAVNNVLAYGEYLLVASASVVSPLEKRDILTTRMVLSFDGHTNSVLTIKIAENMLFSGSGDTTIISWNPENGFFIRKFVGHSGYVNAIAIQDNLLFSGSSDFDIIKWDIFDGTLLTVFSKEHGNPITCLDIWKRTLYSGAEDNSLIKWNISTDLPLDLFRGQIKLLRAVAVWKNFVLSGGDSGHITLWENSVESLEPFAVLVGHLAAINSLIVFEETFFSSGSDSTIRHWNLTDLVVLKVLSDPGNVVGPLVTKSSSSLYSGGTHPIVKKWDVTSGLLTAELIGHSGHIVSLFAFDNFICSASLDKTVRIWNEESDDNTDTINTALPALTVYVIGDRVLVGVVTGLVEFSISTGGQVLYLRENIPCACIVASFAKLYTGQGNGLISARRIDTLSVSQTFYGHQDTILSLYLDETVTLYSASFDGSTKKWNTDTGKLAFSFESRSASVTSLTLNQNQLFVGLKSGRVVCYDTGNGMFLNSLKYHTESVSSLITFNNSIYSSGFDGTILKFSTQSSENVSTVFRSDHEPLKDLSRGFSFWITLQGDSKIVFIPMNSNSELVKIIDFQMPLVCVAATDSVLLAGSKSGIIYARGIKTLQPVFELKGHVSAVNNLLVVDNRLFSASEDKTIIEWSLEDQVTRKTYKRLSASALGHLGPVNSLSYCSDTLFSAGSDLTVRRWNTKAAKHDDVYFGFTKSVTIVVCYNGSVFAGSEDFSVLLFNPSLRQSQDATVKSSTTIMKRNTNQKRIIRLKNAVGSTINVTQVLVSVSIVLAVIIMVILGYGFLKKRPKKITSPPATITSVQGTMSTQTIFDLETVVNSVMGISKHAAYLIDNSVLAKVKKIAAGGGGELFLAKVMDPVLKKKIPETVVQKIVFVKNKVNEEAFYQEVGIMILLNTFPYFCQIIGYTENPLSMVLKNYPDGSLYDWASKNHYGTKIILKILKETASALSVMHSHYLAHCDLKPQNILVAVSNDVPTCFLTDFGITQILSEKIIATKAFHVINLRGLSTHYAAPEALRNFRAKNYVKVEFKAYDIYSFGCLAYEVVTRKTPWSTS
ncbi:hypothetical protein MP638_003450, partial [Amoeboaphelidium occidentale]